LYESVYYALKKCELREIEGIRVNGKIACKLTFVKEGITKHQIDFYQGKAEVNLLDFRQAFGRINAWVHTAKKKFKNQLRQETQNAENREAGL
jgi:hypothetical protein